MDNLVIHVVHQRLKCFLNLVNQGYIIGDNVKNIQAVRRQNGYDVAVVPELEGRDIFYFDWQAVQF